MNETDVQRAIATEVIGRGHTHVVPNVFLWGRSWESDLISLTPSGYAVEFEIKRTTADFRRDKEKPRHKKLARAHDEGQAMSTHRGQGPTRFFYVIGPGVDQAKIEVPGYAALITPSGQLGQREPNAVESIKDSLEELSLPMAPLLHSGKIQEQAKSYLSRGLMHRFWDNG
ncbi:hypothetical protein [Salinibacter grassmerensis]|uniref:hypothetical protein n=1 Tax=Salinibacter grassmerensis TaxID=3040353 RepID=UPI0021E9395A|nr:hypothetical protein [Salinibacter grassmerensis]